MSQDRKRDIMEKFNNNRTRGTRQHFWINLFSPPFFPTTNIIIIIKYNKSNKATKWVRKDSREKAMTSVIWRIEVNEYGGYLVAMLVTETS